MIKPMITRLNHVALAVPDLSAAAEQFEALGASVSKPHHLPDHGVSVVFVELSNTKIELLHPLGEGSPIAGFLQKHPAGGFHHICFDTPDITDIGRWAADLGVRILGDGNPKIGAHDKPVLFLHPKDFHGALIELEEASHP